MSNFENGAEKLLRKNCPHHATITLKIDVRKINQDGSLDPEILGNKILGEYGISNKAIVCTSGSSEADCIKNLITMLEKLNG